MTSTSTDPAPVATSPALIGAPATSTETSRAAVLVASSVATTRSA